MAYQFWKSGLLGQDFLYRQFATRMDGGTLWATTSDTSLAVADHPTFGDAAATYNVIDVRQAYLQKLLKQALTAIGHPQEAERLTHFSYEMVALSHATARELGFAPDPDSEEAKKPFVEVSGRKGLGVKADDLIDRVIEKALVEVDRRQSELPADERRKIAEQIGVAAVRYFLIKYSRTTVIAFDIDEALSFEGESGPYLQYAVVRANNIFQKLHERLGLDEAAMLRAAAVDAARRDQRDDARAVGAGARGLAPRRRRRTGGAVAGVRGARQVRVRPGAAVQRVLPPRARSSTKNATTCGAGAPRRWRITASN